MGMKSSNIKAQSSNFESLIPELSGVDFGI
jgi:hypothetical protein